MSSKIYLPYIHIGIYVTYTISVKAIKFANIFTSTWLVYIVIYFCAYN